MLNMGGVLGAVAGIGIVGLGGWDGESSAALILGISSIAGAAIALGASAPHAEPSGTLSWSPWIGPMRTGGEIRPAVGIVSRF